MHTVAIAQTWNTKGGNRDKAQRTSGGSNQSSDGLTDIETFAKLTGYQPGDFLNDQFVLGTQQKAVA